MNRSSFGSFFNMSLRAGRLFGIPIFLHITLLFFVLPVLTHRGTNAWFNLEASALIVVSILLHELGHALMAKRFNLTGLSITLHGFGGFAMSSGARTWKQSLFISLAGPAVTFLLGGLCIAIGLLGPSTSEQSFLIYFIGKINILLGCLNLIPSFPFDGGNSLHAILTPRMGDFKAMRAVGHLGLVLSTILGLYGLLGGESYFQFFGIIGFITSLTTLLNSGGVKFGEFAADRKARKHMQEVMKREKAKKDEFLGDVVQRQKEREANERLRRLLGDD